MLKEESTGMVVELQEKLQLTPAQIKRWAGKRFLVLIEVNEVEMVEPFRIDKSSYGNMDDWLPVRKIQGIML